MGELIAEVVLGLLRFILIEIFGEILLKFLICGPGFFIGRHILRRDNQEREDALSYVLGLLFWAIIAYFIWKGWSWRTASAR